MIHVRTPVRWSRRRARTLLSLAVLAPLAACGSAQSSEAPEAERITVPAGSALTFRVDETVATQSHAEGDRFAATLVSDVTAGGGVVIPAGATLDLEGHRVQGGGP